MAYAPGRLWTAPPETAGERKVAFPARCCRRRFVSGLFMFSQKVLRNKYSSRGAGHNDVQGPRIVIGLTPDLVHRLFIDISGISLLFMISFGLIRIMTLRIEEPLRNFLRHSPKFRKFHFPPFFTEPAIRTPHFHFDY